MCLLSELVNAHLDVLEIIVANEAKILLGTYCPWRCVMKSARSLTSCLLQTEKYVSDGWKLKQKKLQGKA